MKIKMQSKINVYQILISKLFKSGLTFYLIYRYTEIILY